MLSSPVESVNDAYTRNMLYTVTRMMARPQDGTTTMTTKAQRPMIRVDDAAKAYLIELAAMLTIATGEHCSMTAAMDLLIKHTRSNCGIHDLVDELASQIEET